MPELFARIEGLEPTTQFIKGRSEYFIGDHPVKVEKGVVFFEIHWGLDAKNIPLPPELRSNAVDYTIEGYADRVYGLNGHYKLGEAEGHVESIFLGETRAIGEDARIYLQGRNREEVAELYKLIKSNRISPITSAPTLLMRRRSWLSWFFG